MMSDTPAAEHAADFRFWTQEKLRNADTDRQGHINNAVIGTFFEAGRIEVLDDPEIAEVRKACGIVVAKQTIVYRKELYFPGAVRVGTRVRRIGRTSFEFEQTLLAVNGEVASAESTCVLIDRASRKPTAVPDAMRWFLTGAGA
jgi:acyl-CoA thioester hydrolase